MLFVSPNFQSLHGLDYAFHDKQGVGNQIAVSYRLSMDVRFAMCDSNLQMQILFPLESLLPYPAFVSSLHRESFYCRVPF